MVTIGGSSRRALEQLLPEGIAIEKPVPSLFTFKLTDASLKALSGIVVENASLSLAGTGFRSRGALLLTDWGVSGPATLKLSSYAARHLAENGYKGSLVINWLSGGEQEIRQILRDLAGANPVKLTANTHPAELSSRLWKHLLGRAGLREDLRWSEVGSKGFNRLVGVLTSDSYEISGRARFKEEFVTCGGVGLSEIDLNTLECKKIPGLYFAGEVLDVDAVTGGFNLQAAWSTARAVALALSSV